jgi:hypothetical protein
MQVRYQLRHRPSFAPKGNWTRLLQLADGQVERDHGAVLPEALERVVHAVLLVEHVHHEVAEVQQDPATLCPALTTQRLDASLVELVLDLARRNTSVSGRGPDTSSATRSSPDLASAAVAAMRTSSRARSDAVTMSFGAGVSTGWRVSRAGR